MTQGCILVAGSANLDFVVRVDHVPAPGETVVGGDLQTFPGGKGANQAIACARSGAAATRMLLALGDDAHAQPIEAALRDGGVEIDVVRLADTATGVALIAVSDSAENAICVAPGANAKLLGEHLPALDGIGHLLMQLEIPLDSVTAYASAARAAGVRVILNAAPARPLPASLLRSVDVLIVNQGELAAIAATGGTIAEQLAAVDVACAIVTLGTRGCCARERGAYTLQPAFAIEAVDSTGAGDTFCGAFVAASARGDDIAASLRFASASAALSTRSVGAQAGIPLRAAVDAFLGCAPRSSAVAVAELAAYCGTG